VFKLKSLLKVFLLIILGLAVALCRVSQLDNPSFLDEIINKVVYISLASLFVILFVWALIRYKRSKKNPKKFMYFPMLLCLVIGCSFTLVPFLYNLQDKSPTILLGRYKHGLEFGDEYYIDFRADGTYKLEIGRLFGSHYSRGTYKRKDNIFECDDDIIDTIIRSNRFLVRTDTTYEMRHEPKDSAYTIIKKRIYPIAKKGEIIGNSAVFEVVGKR
jgi:hypothetical protein